MPTVRTHGIDMHYVATGLGEPVLLIAGFGCDQAIWSLVVPTLATRFQVYVIDNRGIGSSTGIGSVESMPQMAEDTAGALDALGLKSVHLVGHSMGSMIAQELTLKHPKRVKSLTLISSCSRQDSRGKALIKMWGELPARLDVESATRLILPWIYTEAFYATPGLVDNLVALIVANPAAHAPATLRGQAQAILEFNTSERLGEIRCPTLVVVGGEDILLPPAASQYLAQHIPFAELVVLPGAAHGLLVEAPEVVAQTLLAFLTQQA
ncbi:alpha/beta hydrolase [soil metagenome]